LAQTALIYYLIPVLVEYWPFLNQAIVLTQIISMVIITGLLLTNKKHDF
jgi:hypothetical protein